MVSLQRLAIVLVLVAAASALLLAELDAITAPKIKASRTAFKLKMVKKVLPAYDNDPNSDRQVLPVDISGTAHAKAEPDDDLGKEGLIVYPAYKDGKLVGQAFAVVTHEGYSGDIDILLGVDPQGKVTGVEIISHAETPGLGSKITAEKTWAGKAQLIGRTLSDSLKVKKDGGEIDAIAGATISPRAVCKAVKAGLETHSKKLKGAEPAAPATATTTESLFSSNTGQGMGNEG